MKNIIDIENVNLRIGKTDILKNVNINFEKGKIHGLIGRNGSGKTADEVCLWLYKNNIRYHKS